MSITITKVYIYSDWMWYSISKESFIKLANRKKEFPEEGLRDLEDYAKMLKQQPESIFVEAGNLGSNPFYCTNPNHHMVIGIIDFKSEDWDYHISMVDFNWQVVSPTKKEAIPSDAIKFAEWLRTFEVLTKENGYWVLESQISSIDLYKIYLKDSPTEISEAIQGIPTINELESKIREYYGTDITPELDEWLSQTSHSLSHIKESTEAKEKICHKTDQVCQYDCSGLCKESV